MEDRPDSAATASRPKITDCEIAVAWVVFDVVVLALGAVGLRASAAKETIVEIAEIVGPEMNALQKQVAIIAADGTTAFARAKAAFSILGTLSGGSMLGAVFGAFRRSLTWWQGLLYGISGLATILAALATDGVSLCAQIVLLLTSFAFLVSDSVHAVKTCGLTPTPDRTEAPPAGLNPNPTPYLPQLALMTRRGDFVTVTGGLHLDATSAFSTDRRAVGAWETFTIEPVDAANHTFAIRTANGRYVSAVDGGGQAGAAGHSWGVRTDANRISPTETLVLQMQVDGGYALMTQRGYYVTAVGGGGKAVAGDPMRTDATAVGLAGAEVFTAQILPSDGLTASQAAELTGSTILDAGFESPSVGAGHYEYQPSGGRWLFSPSAGLTANNSGFTKNNPPAPNGTQVAFLQKASSVSQSVLFAEGTYRLHFYAAQRSGYKPNALKVFVDDVEVGDVTPSGTDYRVYTTNAFTVTTGHHLIRFESTNGTQDATCFIDLVQAVGA